MSHDTHTRRDVIAMTGAGLTVAATLSGGTASAQQAPTRTALITGCSSGFGRLAALDLARAGFTTFAGNRETQGRNAEAAASLTAEADGLPLTVLDLDVRDSDSVTAALEATGPLDILVNNAGYILAGSIELHDEEDVAAQFDTNLVGYHRLIRAALPGMRANGSGLIVQVSSGLGRIVFPTQGWYVATKFAIEGMSEALAYELAPFGVDVTILQPTAYPTQFLPNGRQYFEELVTRLDGERSSAYAEQMGMTRFGLQDEPGPDPTDVATAIRELAEMPQGTRPLRRIASPFPDGLERINAGLSAAQDAVFEGTPFAEWRNAVVE